MKMYRLFVFVSLILASQLGHAFAPASGLWWNPNESGRGFTIDTQGPGIMIVTAYVYQPSGPATWFLTAGAYNNATNTYSGTLGAYTNGQCFGCAFKSPNAVAAGTVTIVFNTPESGTMTFPGGSTHIEHEPFGYTNKNDYFLGEWAFSFATSGLINTQWVVFDGHYTGSDGTVYASGQEDSTSGTVALGFYHQPSNSFAVAIADNVGYSFLYIFSGDDKRMLGLGAIFPTGSTAPNPSEPSSGNRLLYASELGSSTPLSRPGVAAERVSVADAGVRYGKLEGAMQYLRATLDAK